MREWKARLFVFGDFGIALSTYYIHSRSKCFPLLNWQKKQRYYFTCFWKKEMEPEPRRQAGIDTNCLTGGLRKKVRCKNKKQ